MLRLLLATGIVVVVVISCLTTIAAAYGQNWTQTPWIPERVPPTTGDADVYDPNPTRSGLSISSMAYDLPTLARDADLVIAGKVLAREQGENIGELDPCVPEASTTFPTINSQIQVQKVLKGNYPANKNITVVTEGDLTGKLFVEGSADIKEGEVVVLFLSQEPVYDNAWIVLGQDQGKFNIDDKGQVHGNLYVNVNASSVDGMGDLIKKALSEPLPEGQNLTPNDTDLKGPAGVMRNDTDQSNGITC